MIQQSNWMGQINCQCQYSIASEDHISFKTYQKHLPSYNSTDNQTESPQISIILTLRHKNNFIEQVKIEEKRRICFGTVEGCDYYPIRLDGNMFKMSVRYANHAAMIKDQGVGLGVFILKKKWTIKPNNQQHMFQIDEKMIIIKIKPNGLISYSFYDEESRQSGVLESKDEIEIEMKGEKLLLRRQREGKEYTARRIGQKKNIWVWLGQEGKVKPRDVLRLGRQFYQVQGVRSYLQSSKIVTRY